eukprot:UN14121
MEMNEPVGPMWTATIQSSNTSNLAMTSLISLGGLTLQGLLLRPSQPNQRKLQAKWTGSTSMSRSLLPNQSLVLGVQKGKILDNRRAKRIIESSESRGYEIADHDDRPGCSSQLHALWGEYHPRKYCCFKRTTGCYD